MVFHVLQLGQPLRGVKVEKPLNWRIGSAFDILIVLRF